MTLQWTLGTNSAFALGPRKTTENLDRVAALSGCKLTSQDKVTITLRLAVYRQSVRFGAKPLETHDQIFFFNPCVLSPYVTSSDEKMGLSLMLRLLSSVRIAHIACYWTLFLLHYIQVLCQYRLCKVHHAYVTYLMVQRQLSHLNGRNLDRRQV
jgi:hypothetical protein